MTSPLHLGAHSCSSQVAEGIIWAWLGGWRRIDPLELDLIASSPSPRPRWQSASRPRALPAGARPTGRRERPGRLRCAAQGGSFATPATHSLPRHLGRPSRCILAGAVPRAIAGRARRRRQFRSTLRAYFFGEKPNISSAAAALRVSSRTVHGRLRAIEERLSRPLGASLAEIETALRLQDFDVHLGWSEPVASRN